MRFTESALENCALKRKLMGVGWLAGLMAFPPQSWLNEVVLFLQLGVRDKQELR